MYVDNVNTDHCLFNFLYPGIDWINFTFWFILMINLFILFVLFESGNILQRTDN